MGSKARSKTWKSKSSGACGRGLEGLQVSRGPTRRKLCRSLNAASGMAKRRGSHTHSLVDIPACLGKIVSPLTQPPQFTYECYRSTATPQLTVGNRVTLHWPGIHSPATSHEPTLLHRSSQTPPDRFAQGVIRYTEQRILSAWLALSGQTPGHSQVSKNMTTV